MVRRYNCLCLQLYLLWFPGHRSLNVGLTVHTAQMVHGTFMFIVTSIDVSVHYKICQHSQCLQLSQTQSSESRSLHLHMDTKIQIDTLPEII